MCLLLTFPHLSKWPSLTFGMTHMPCPLVVITSYGYVSILRCKASEDSRVLAIEIMTIIYTWSGPDFLRHLSVTAAGLPPSPSSLLDVSYFVRDSPDKPLIVTYWSLKVSHLSVVITLLTSCAWCHLWVLVFNRPLTVECVFLPSRTRSFNFS